MKYSYLFEAIKSISPNITTTELEQIIPLLQQNKFKKGQFIVCPGQNHRKFNFIEKGSGRMYHVKSDGTECNIILGIEGNFLQDYESLIYNRPSAFFVQALEDSEIISIDYEKFEQLLSSTINWEHCGRLINQFILIGVFKHVQSLMFLQPEEIYLRLLREEPYLLERFSLEHIATYIGVKRESLSRIRKRLVKERRI